MISRQLITGAATAALVLVAAAAAALEPPEELVGTTWDTGSGLLYFTHDDVLMIDGSEITSMASFHPGAGENVVRVQGLAAYTVCAWSCVTMSWTPGGTQMAVLWEHYGEVDVAVLVVDDEDAAE